ncbi:sterol carrier protein domain-containing protein [Lactobacillus hominis]|nr:sterol carrier protein domain-containing protein [Lactobacillus hominis]MCT3348800.1 hypothetical protein [Lactobacillus hominis]
MMTRIINMKQVLQSMQLINEENLVIKISGDEIIEENNGIWKLTKQNNKIWVGKSNAQPDYAASLTNWTKVLLGYLTLKQAVELNFVKQYHKVPNDFVKGEVSFYDYF